MRMGLAIDASCDLPPAFIEQHAIAVMPIAVNVDGEKFKDSRDLAEIQRFIDMKLGDRSHSASTEPCSVEDVQALFLERLVLERDCVFCLTITATRSPIYDNVIKATYGVLKHYRDVRDPLSVPGPFLMRVIDTRSLFSGEAPVVVEATRMFATGATPAAIRERLTYVANNSYTYMLPRDLHYIRARTRSKGDRSISLLSAVFGTALDIKPLLRCFRGETGPVGKVRGFEPGARTLFDYACQRVRAGLLVPAMCLSYGGDLAEIAKLPGYDTLREVCAAHDVAVMEAPMSITGMTNVGEGALTLGFAAEEHPIEF